jgi:flagellar hook assembly protein FlgD
LDVDQNVPNPFNPSTAIHFEIRDHERVTVRVFDVSGREVARLLDAVLAPGRHLIEWHGQADNGIAVSSGTYVLRVETSHQAKDVKLVLLR